MIVSAGQSDIARYVIISVPIPGVDLERASVMCASCIRENNEIMKMIKKEKLTCDSYDVNEDERCPVCEIAGGVYN